MALDSITNWTKGERKKGRPLEQTLKDRAKGRDVRSKKHSPFFVIAHWVHSTIH